jgi:GDSL-like Lipase/Acylhydrolase family
VERTTEKEAGTVRIVGLGDSFLFGWGVAAEETFLRRLEPLLQRATGTKVETVNMGVPGWGLNQYYLRLKHQGVNYSPNVVLLSYFADDLTGPPLEKVESVLADKPEFKGGMLHHFRVYNVLRSVAKFVDERNRTTRFDYLHDLEARRRAAAQLYNLMTDYGTELTAQHAAWLKAHLERIQDLASGNGASLVIVYIPDVSQLGHPEVQHVNRVLADVTRALDLPLVDMTSTFERDPNKFYLWPEDPHATAAGHLAIANALRPIVCRALESQGIPCRDLSVARDH